MDKVTGQCPQTTTFLKRKESRSGYRTEVLPLTSLTPYRWAKPALQTNRSTLPRSCAPCSVHATSFPQTQTDRFAILTQNGTQRPNDLRPWPTAPVKWGGGGWGQRVENINVCNMNEHTSSCHARESAREGQREREIERERGGGRGEKREKN